MNAGFCALRKLSYIAGGICQIQESEATVDKKYYNTEWELKIKPRKYYRSQNQLNW